MKRSPVHFWAQNRERTRAAFARLHRFTCGLKTHGTTADLAQDLAEIERFVEEAKTTLKDEAFEARRTRLTKTTAILLAFMLAGCAHKTVWVKPGATVVEFETDKLRCDYEARAATATYGAGMGAIEAGVGEGLKRVELMQLCLRTKGWNPERVPT